MYACRIFLFKVSQKWAKCLINRITITRKMSAAGSWDPVLRSRPAQERRRRGGLSNNGGEKGQEGR